MAVKWKWNNNAGGGNVPADLENRVQTLENEAVKKTGDQSIAGTKTFTKQGEPIQVKPTTGSAYITGYTGTTKKWSIGNNGSDNHFKLEANTADGSVLLAPGTNGDALNNSSKTWNNYQDNTVLRQKDFKYTRKFEYTSVAQPNTTWNYTSWNWTLNSPANINVDGLHKFLVVMSFQDNIAFSFEANIVWKEGLSESQSNMFMVEKSGITFYFQCAIKSGNKFHIYTKKSATGGSNTNISWVRMYILRDNNLPTKMSSVW